jgi:tight adherence protein B
MDAPVSTEFDEILKQARLGGSFEDALGTMVSRVDSEDLRIVARALEIHRKVGGDLGEVLDQVAATMREREELRGHVRALTAQQRLSGWIIAALPIWVVGFFMLTDSELISALWRDAAGLAVMGVGATMELVALVLMRRILSIEV